MSFKQDEAISILNGKPLKLEDQFIYLCFNISSTESDINIRKLSIKWKSDLFEK